MGNKLRDTLTFESDFLYFKPGNNIPTINLDTAPGVLRNIDIPLSASAEFEFTADVDSQTASRLLGIDLSSVPDASFTVEFNAPYQEQIRKHKKKRINKKWAKRYGYRTVVKPRRFESVTFRESNPEEYEFTGYLTR